MNILGIGPLELLLIIILMLIFLGPEDLPVAARKLAEWWRQLQQLSDEVSTWVQEELEPELEEVQRLKEEAKKAAEASRKAVTAVQRPGEVLAEEVRRSLAPHTKQAKEPAAPPPDSGEEEPSVPVPQPARRPLAPPDELAEEGDRA